MRVHAAADMRGMKIALLLQVSRWTGVIHGTREWKFSLGTYETRNTGFLFGNVVDMFEFHAYWPDWIPWLGGKEIFPAVWNIADASITMGVIMVFVRHNSYVDGYMTRAKRIREVRRHKQAKRKTFLNN